MSFKSAKTGPGHKRMAKPTAKRSAAKPAAKTTAKRTVAEPEAEAEAESEPDDTEWDKNGIDMDTGLPFEDSGYEVVTYSSFDEMGLQENILRGVYSYGYEKPSVIQQKAIVTIMNRNDVLGQSQSGTGKTAAFSIGMLERITPEDNHTQAIVVAPTRELAMQIEKVIMAISQFTTIKTHLIIGQGKLSSYRKYKTVKEQADDAGGINSHIIIGTPGRISNYIETGKLDMSGLKLVIMDEADELFSYGFKQQIDYIIRCIPKETNICLFSATLPADVKDLAAKLMHKPVHILVKNQELTLDGIKQFYVDATHQHYKFGIICDLFKFIPVTQTIIYCNSKNSVRTLAEKMTANDFTVSYISSDLDQDMRTKTLADFTAGKIRVLIATDIIARGIDIQQVSLIINYDMPKEKEVYLHRIGRSGRFGRKGISINMLTPREFDVQRRIEEFYATQIDELPENLGDYTQDLFKCTF